MADRRITAVISAVDRASPTFTRIRSAIAGLGAVAAAVGAVQIGRKLVQGISAAVEASSQQEAAEIRLAQALALRGKAVDQVLPKLKAQASELQNLTGVGDELILENQSLLVSLGNLSGRGLDRATRASLDLSAALGVSQRTAFDLVAKAASGYTSTLSRYGIILDEGLDQSQKFEAALRLIEQRFGGQAQAQLNTYIGRLGEFQGRVGDLQEAIGGPFRDVFQVVLAQGLSPLVARTTEAISASDAFRNAILSSGIAVAELGGAIESLVRSPGFQRFIGVLTGAAIVGGKIAFGELERQVEAITKLFGGDVGESPFFDSIKRELEALKGTTAADRIQIPVSVVGTDAGGSATDEPLPIFIPRTLDEIQRFLNQREPLVIPAGFEPGVPLAPDTQVGGSLPKPQEVVTVGELIQRNINDKFGDAEQLASRFADTLVDAAFEGRLAFKEFFKALLRDMARAIAQALILRAILAVATKGGSEVLGRGGIVGQRAQSGLIVRGGIPGRDSVPIVAQQGEAVLPPQLTRFLIEAASQGRGPSTNVTISAVDGESVRRLLEDNPDAIAAAFRNANRVGAA